MNTAHKISDICDLYGDRVRLAWPMLQAFGPIAFSGRIATVKVFEDNLLVREMLSSDGKGQVLVVDGGGSTRCALIGDQMATLALENGWVGAIVHGCIRDVTEIDALKFGIRALGVNPFRSAKRGAGEKNVAVKFAGIVFTPGEYVYVDADGILVSELNLDAR